MLSNFINQFTDLLFPPRCLSCSQTVIYNGTLWASCFSEINFITKPNCYICSFPFEYEIENALCLSCIKEKPKYNKAHIVFRYDENSKKLIHKLKYSDCTYLVPYLAKFMYNLISNNDFDYIAPIPMHNFKLFKRFYNQSLLLAQNINKNSKIEIIPDLLKKVKNIPAQSSLSQKKRKDNVKGAYIFNKKYANLINNKKFLLVDDVITTGATINYCSKLLIESYAKSVEIIALAKTIKS